MASSFTEEDTWSEDRFSGSSEGGPIPPHELASQLEAGPETGPGPLAFVQTESADTEGDFFSETLPFFLKTSKKKTFLIGVFLHFWEIIHPG